MIPTTVGMLFPIYIDEKIRSKLFCKSGQKKVALFPKNKTKKQNKNKKQKKLKKKREYLWKI